MSADPVDFIPCTADLLPRPFGQARLAVLRGVYWEPGTTITVGFLDGPDAETRRLILSHANAWRDAGARILFVETQTNPMVRITRGATGYWSYLGKGVLDIPASQPTMNLQGFTARSPESEYRRVVRHEFGHTLGFPHEHQRAAIVALLDPAGCYRYFGGPPNNWSRQMIDQQELTPIPDSQLWSIAPSDQHSIMCYSYPPECTKAHVAIPGGLDLTAIDRAFAATVYPGLVDPPPLVRPALVPDGTPVLGMIERAGERDEYSLKLGAAGRYVIGTVPVMEVGVFDGPGTKLIGRNYGEVSMDLAVGEFVVKVMHHLRRGVGPYSVTCRKASP